MSKKNKTENDVINDELAEASESQEFADTSLGALFDEDDLVFEQRSFDIVNLGIGEVYVGIYKGIEQKTSKKGEEFTYIILENKTADKVGFWLWAGLKQALDRNNVEINEVIKITRKENVPFITDEGKEVECNNYDIRVGKKKGK